MRPGRHLCAVAAIILSATFATAAHAGDPKVPPAQDPGLTPIALVGYGVDYTDAQIAQRLARDGEGNIVGWDFVDNDIFPYSTNAASNAEAKLLLGKAAVELAPVRIGPADYRAVAGAASFVSHTPVQTVIVTLTSDQKADWEIFIKAAQAFPKLLFVVPAGDAKPRFPAALKLDNVLSVSPPAAKDETADVAFAGPTPESAAILAAAAIATCHAPAIGPGDGKARKAAILSKLAQPRSASRVPAIEPCS